MVYTFLMPNIFLFLHLIFLVIGFGSVIVIDTFGLLFLLKKRKISEVMKVAQVTQVLIWVGWFGLVGTGLLLGGLNILDNPLMVTKLFLVMMLGLNGVMLHFLKLSLEKLGDKPIPTKLMIVMGGASTISQIGWWGATILGFLIASGYTP